MSEPKYKKGHLVWTANFNLDIVHPIEIVSVIAKIRRSNVVSYCYTDLHEREYPEESLFKTRGEAVKYLENPHETKEGE